MRIQVLLKKVLIRFKRSLNHLKMMMDFKLKLIFYSLTFQMRARKNKKGNASKLKLLMLLLELKVNKVKV